MRKANANDLSERDVAPDPQLLFTRKQVAALIGASTMTVFRLEKQGRLHGIRLTNKPSSQVFFRREEVMALVEGDADAR